MTVLLFRVSVRYIHEMGYARHLLYQVISIFLLRFLSLLRHTDTYLFIPLETKFSRFSFSQYIFWIDMKNKLILNNLPDHSQGPKQDHFEVPVSIFCNKVFPIAYCFWVIAKQVKIQIYTICRWYWLPTIFMNTIFISLDVKFLPLLYLQYRIGSHEKQIN